MVKFNLPLIVYLSLIVYLYLAQMSIANSKTMEVSIPIVINTSIPFHPYHAQMPAPVAPIDFLAYEVICLIHQVHDLYSARLDEAKLKLKTVEAEPESPKDPLGIRKSYFGKELHVSNATNYVNSLKKLVDDTEWTFRKAVAFYSQMTNMFLVEAPGSGNPATSMMSHLTNLMLIYFDDQVSLTNNLLVKASALIAYEHSNRTRFFNLHDGESVLESHQAYYAHKREIYKDAKTSLKVWAYPSYDHPATRFTHQQMGNVQCNDLLDLSILK